MIRKRRAQEEMIGFALIIILVSVILLVFLGFSLNKDKDVEPSYEVGNFIQAFMQYTTDCSHYSVQELIFECYNNETCSDGASACGVLESTLSDISEKSWSVGENRPYKGYELRVDLEGKPLIKPIIKGNISKNYKESSIDYSKKGQMFFINFRIYY